MRWRRRRAAHRVTISRTGAHSGAARDLRWSQPGSNRRPSGCHPDALPTELWPQETPQFSRELEIVSPFHTTPLVVPGSAPARGIATDDDIACRGSPLASDASQPVAEVEDQVAP